MTDEKNTIHIHAAGGLHLMVIEVDPDAYDFEIYNSYRKELRYLKKGHENPLTGAEFFDVIHLRGFRVMDDSLEILGSTKDITDDEVGNIVAEIHLNGELSGFFDYSNPHSMLFTRKESLLSLITISGGSPEKNYCILKINQ